MEAPVLNYPDIMLWMKREMSIISGMAKQCDLLRPSRRIFREITIRFTEAWYWRGAESVSSWPPWWLVRSERL